MNLNFLLYRFIGIFALLFVVLYLSISNISSLEKTIGKFNAAAGELVFNVLNPELHTDISQGAPPNPKGFDMTILIYDKRTTKKEASLGVYQDHFLLFVLPFIFLTSLFLASPVDRRTKIIRYLIGLLLLYVLIAFHLSYRFELVLSNNNFEINSIWLFFTWLFGLGGTFDNIFIIVAVIWIALMGWPIFKKITSD